MKWCEACVWDACSTFRWGRSPFIDLCFMSNSEKCSVKWILARKNSTRSSQSLSRQLLHTFIWTSQPMRSCFPDLIHLMHLPMQDVHENQRRNWAGMILWLAWYATDDQMNDQLKWSAKFTIFFPMVISISSCQTDSSSVNILSCITVLGALSLSCCLHL